MGRQYIEQPPEKSIQQACINLSSLYSAYYYRLNIPTNTLHVLVTCKSNPTGKEGIIDTVFQGTCAGLSQ